MKTIASRTKYIFTFLAVVVLVLGVKSNEFEIAMAKDNLETIEQRVLIIKETEEDLKKSMIHEIFKDGKRYIGEVKKIGKVELAGNDKYRALYEGEFSYDSLKFEINVEKNSRDELSDKIFYNAKIDDRDYYGFLNLDKENVKEKDEKNFIGKYSGWLSNDGIYKNVVKTYENSEDITDTLLFLEEIDGIEFSGILKAKNSDAKFHMDTAIYEKEFEGYIFYDFSD